MILFLAIKYYVYVLKSVNFYKDDAVEDKERILICKPLIEFLETMVYV